MKINAGCSAFLCIECVGCDDLGSVMYHVNLFRCVFVGTVYHLANRDFYLLFFLYLQSNFEII
jgi:hypothetical protein